MIPKTILVTNRTNVHYLSGFTGTSGYLVLHDNKIIDITESFDDSWKAFLKKYRIRKVGIEGFAVNYNFWKKLKKISKGVKLVDIGNYLSEKRMSKKPHELTSLKKAQSITDGTLAALKKWLRSGLSEKEIAWKIEILARELGADEISFPPIVAINQNSASPHHHPTNKKLKRGDLILIDMGVIYKGYCSDMTRMVFTKKPTAEEEKVYNIVLKAQEAGISKLKVGIIGKKVDTYARNVIIKAGYGYNFGHSLGHGVGLDIHELPNLSKKSNDKIAENSVVTVEPGIYLPGKFGVRIEDMIVVRKKGTSNLTKSPKTIQSSIINLK